MSREPDVRAALVALQPQLRRFAYGLCASMDEADDLVQSAYERALSRLTQWQPGTRLDSWMYRIVQSIWFNRHEARKVRDRHADSERADALTESGVDRIVEGRMTLEKVRAFVHTIPDEQRAVLMLVCVEGLSYKEVAEVLELPVGTVTSRLGRARRALRQHLDGATPSALRASHKRDTV